MLALTFLLFTIVATVLAIGVQFMDCPGNDAPAQQGMTRKCCTSDQLPKGCECYDISSTSAYTNTLLHAPHCPTDIQATFHLYTRAHRTTPQTIRAGDSHIRGTSFNGTSKTVFLAHGFTDNGNTPWCITMKNTLLDEGNMNVIVVNWEQGAKAPNYFQAAANTRTVGSMVAHLIQDLHTYGHAHYGNFHLVGHSLGGQLLAYAGKEVFRLTNQKIGRISGLDAAGPNFETYTNFVRIDSTDAQFVDLIHTDARPVMDAGFGIRSSVGHVDFYPNGGVHQPGCPQETIGIYSLTNFIAQIAGGACSHSRAIQYFTNSIHRCRYLPPNGNPACTMGYHVSKSCRGEIYPTTTATEPYC